MAEPVIRLEGLTFSYPGNRQALVDVSLEVGRGEKVAIVGPNGAGKSTLFLHLNGTLHSHGSHGSNGSHGPDGAPVSGRVTVAGVVVTPARDALRTVRAKVGLVFQDPDDQLFSPTVFEDVAFGPLHLRCPRDEVRERVERALAAVGMTGHEKHMPHHLSLGERKRVAIATVLAMDPEVLVLDEPSAGLDPRARRALIGLLKTLPQTMLVASHDMRLVWELCPRTVILDAGRVVADGPTRELLADSELMERHGLESP